MQFKILVNPQLQLKIHKDSKLIKLPFLGLGSNPNQIKIQFQAWITLTINWVLFKLQSFYLLKFQATNIAKWFFQTWQHIVTSQTYNWISLTSKACKVHGKISLWKHQLELTQLKCLWWLDKKQITWTLKTLFKFLSLRKNSKYYSFKPFVLNS